jgi:predicted Fe-Mo cluster-binding NifX family protein
VLHKTSALAVPVTRSNQIDAHFGHCEFFNVYRVSDNNIILEIQTIESEKGCGCKSNIASVLFEQGVTIMLAGGIGGGAINVLNSVGIQVIRGCSGDAHEIIEQYITGKISDSNESCMQHEHHNGHGGHVCKH